MSLESPIADVLAKYWLEENPYCGLSSSEIRGRLPGKLGTHTTARALGAALSRMEKRGEISTRKTAGGAWAYPKRPLLEPRDPLAHADVGVYTRELRLGGVQYERRFFQRQVLDRYLQDPRYKVEEWGSGGTLGIRDRFYLDPDTPPQDRVGIQSYGVAYKGDGTQAVAVPLIDLGRLSKEHQQHWASWEIHESLSLDADYYRQEFEGEWTDRVSPFDAMLQELREINRLCDLIGYPHLFRTTFDDEIIPGYGWLTKATSHALEEFIRLLDRLLSDNMQREFFDADGIPLSEEIKRKDGTIECRNKGSIRLLEEFVRRHFRLQEPEVLDELVDALRDVRRRRGRPSHAVTDNVHEPGVLAEQKEIMGKVYDAVRSLRLMFMLYPKASSYRPPDWLQKGRIG
jgi:hypothetical protein